MYHTLCTKNLLLTIVITSSSTLTKKGSQHRLLPSPHSLGLTYRLRPCGGRFSCIITVFGYILPLILIPKILACSE